jgi:hypothetical protein
MDKPKFRRLEARFLRQLNELDPVGIYHADDNQEYLGEVHWLLLTLPGLVDEKELAKEFSVRLHFQFGVTLKAERLDTIVARLWGVWSRSSASAG